MKFNNKAIASYLNLGEASKKSIEVHNKISRSWLDFYEKSMMGVLEGLADDEDPDNSKAKAAFMKSLDEAQELNKKNAEVLGDFCLETLGETYQVGYAEGTNAATQGLIKHFRELIEDGKVLQDPDGKLSWVLDIVEKETDKAFRKQMKDKTMNLYFEDEEKKNEEE